MLAVAPAGRGGSGFSDGRHSCPPLRIRPELVGRHDLDRRDHLGVAEPAIFMARHQQVAGLGEARVDLRDIARDDHRVDVGAGDQNAVNHVRAGEAQRHVAVCRKHDAIRHELELRRDHPGDDPAIRVDARSQIFLGELGRQGEAFFGSTIFAVARRVDVHRQRREQDCPEDDGDDASDDHGPAQLGLAEWRFR